MTSAQWRSYRGLFKTSLMDEAVMEGSRCRVTYGPLSVTVHLQSDWSYMVTWPDMLWFVPRSDGSVYERFLLCGQWAGVAAGRLDYWSELWSGVQIYPNLHTHRTLLTQFNTHTLTHVQCRTVYRIRVYQKCLTVISSSVSRTTSVTIYHYTHTTWLKMQQRILGIVYL